MVQIVEEKGDLGVFEICQQIDDPVDGRTRPVVAFGRHGGDEGMGNRTNAKCAAKWARSRRVGVALTFEVLTSIKSGPTAHEEPVVEEWKKQVQKSRTPAEIKMPRTRSRKPQTAVDCGGNPPP